MGEPNMISLKLLRSMVRRIPGARTLNGFRVEYRARCELFFSPFFALRREGNVKGAVLFLLCSLVKSKRPIRVSFRSRHLMIRPCTPDLYVVQSCFGGELDAAISAASPLKYNFIIDAGGYIGTSAIVLAEAFPQARVVSLEPSVENFKVLSSNVKGYPNIVAINQALGSAARRAILRDPKIGEWGFTLVEAETLTALHSVQVTTVPRLLQEFSEEGIDILKLDIEGSELELLRDCSHWIQRCRVIVAELHDWIIPGCEAGFREAMRNRSPVDCGSEKRCAKLAE
jgi:FkbM family methyltransferase